MTDQERREKARRIAEAYIRITGAPHAYDMAGQHTGRYRDIENAAYDKLCWAEAMAEVEAADDDRCRHKFLMLGSHAYDAPHPDHKCENCDMTYAEVLAELAKK